MLRKEHYAQIADRKRARLKKLETKRRAKGDEDGARRASIGAAVAAQIANEIRRGLRKRMNSDLAFGSGGIRLNRRFRMQQ